jgi:hypothetical protein
MSGRDLRNELIETLRSISEIAPQMRIGQLTAAVGEVCGDFHGRALWEAEDRELLEAARKLHHDLESANAVQTNQPVA